jgi:hypothetical protein
VLEQKRTVWQLDHVLVRDGGPSGSPGSVFARQGVFIP